MDKLSIDDLARSGLTPEDIGAREAGQPDFAAIKVPGTSKGYVIPYYNLDGERIPFYRVKLFGYVVDGKPQKYKQAPGTGNNLYFPKGFKQALAGKKYVILTEGEKKANAAVKNGIPCVALGGVDSWRNNTIIVPAESKIDLTYKKQGQLRIKVPSGTTVGEDCTLAFGLQPLVDLCIKNGLAIIICFDTDDIGVKFDVQRAASSLGMQFRHMGMSTENVRQLVLPISGEKVGVDDYLVKHGGDAMQVLIQETMDKRVAFPKHPNARAIISSKLQSGKLDRKEMQEVALTILSDLDVRGRRLISTMDGSPYYFDEHTYKLMPATMVTSQGEPLHESPFGRFLYKEYGVSAADGRLLLWLAAQFTGESPVNDVEPKRITTITGKDNMEVAIQISDSHFALVTGDKKKPIQILVNGSNGLLFEQEQVEATDPQKLKEEFERQLIQPVDAWWYKVFTDAVNITGGDSSARLASTLYYISPFLFRWKGTQLPVELVIGEPGSGKSSLYELRLGILTGNPLLRNVPSDLRDWYASVVNTGGLHVIDNVQFTDKALRQRMSDEMCRITTEPKPQIEMRKLYTTSGQNRYPVTSVFAMTAVQMPFYNNDLLQRAAVLEMGAVQTGHDSNWVGNQMNRFGGRTAWLAHQMVVLHHFLRRVHENGWNSEYRAGHRLANYEQCLQLMSEVLGIESTWVVPELSARMQRTMTDADWTLEAVKEYVEYLKKHFPKDGKYFTAGDIAEWAEGHEEHRLNQQLVNSRSVGRYLISHTTILEKVTGAKYVGTKANRKIFYVGPKDFP